MCGFLVTVGGSKAFTHRDLSPMKRRGPDGMGFWTDGWVSIGQTRLSVVGLDDRSLAPIENSRYVLAFNGEIYNFLSISRSVTGLPATSDTQVLLDAWTIMGPKILPMLEGFWSFAVFDKQAQTLTICRDQFGVKPLYYSCLDGFVASSTLAPLLATLRSKPELNTGAMSEWARYQIVPSGRTFFHGVHKLPPGEILTWKVDTGEITTVQAYENIWAAQGDVKPTAKWIDEAREILRDAVDDAATSDIAVTSTCSGGLDSSLVTRLLAPEVAYHGNFQDASCNETTWAQAAVDGIDTRLMVTNCREDFDLVERLDSLVEDFDELAVGSAILPIDDVFGQVTRRFKVCLLGTGGDELFSGYSRYQMSLGVCPQESYRAAFTRLGPIANSSVWQRFESCHVKGDTSLYKFYDPGCRVNFMEQNVGSGLGAMLRFDRKVFLEALLTIDDRIGGRHGIEGRPALLHQRFVRRTLELDPAELGGKRVLREIARGILPDAVIDRQDKMGFTVPIGPMVNANASRIREALSSSRFRDLYNLRRLSFTAETMYSREVFGLLELDCWLRRYA